MSGITGQRALVALGVAAGGTAAAVYVSRDVYRGLLRWALGEVATAKGSPSVLAGAVLAACSAAYGRPRLLDLQPSLPPLPLPGLKDTLARFLESVRPILSPLEYWRTEKAALELAVSPSGRALQQQLESMRSASLRSGAAETSWKGIGDRNWLAQTWLRFAYLRGRAPLPVNVSFYSTDQVRVPPKTPCQAARAAGLVLGVLSFWDRVVTGSLPPFLAGKGAAKAPVDMSGYGWMLGTVRVPGEEEDELVVHEVGRHPDQPDDDRRHLGDADVLVARGTALFAVPVQRGGARVTFSELWAAMRAVIEAVPAPEEPAPVPRDAGAAAAEPGRWSFPDSPPVTLLTTSDRTSWAQARSGVLLRDEAWAAAVSRAERALLGVSLFFEGHGETGGRECGVAASGEPGAAGAGTAAEAAGHDGTAASGSVSDSANRIARTGFTGHGWSWWCDKTVSVGVFADGRSCWHIEHTPADAPVPSHLVEHAVVTESDIVHAHIGGGEARADRPDGPHASRPAPPGAGLATHEYPPLPAGSPPSPSPALAPERLRFPGAAAHTDLVGRITAAADDFRALCASTGLALHIWDRWGSDDIKRRFRCAPDAFVQTVLQATSLRFFGRAVLTYESASTRAFAHGRTETIRSATLPSAHAADVLRRLEADGAEDDAERAAEALEAVRTSCQAHRARTREAMAGRGVDRHLLALRIADAGRAAATGAPLSSLWSSPGWALEYELSTSQTPLVQEHRAALPSTDVLSLGGGFGPSCAGGVGVSYFVLDRFLYFHVATNRTADNEAACGAPAAAIGGLAGEAGSPLAHAVAFGRELCAVLRTLERASRAADPGAWTDGVRPARL